MEACRICLSERNLVDMRSKLIQDNTVYNIFFEFCGLEIPANQTAMVCLHCNDFLKTFHVMKSRALTSNVKFLYNLLDLEIISETTNEVEKPFNDDKEVITEKSEDTKNIQQHGKFWCPYCFQTFSKQCHFVKHRTKEIQDNGGLECHFCSFKSLSRYSLTTHIRYMHLKESLTCTTCNQTFAGKTQLDHHIKIKHENFRFICHICSKEVTRKSRLQTHIRAVHEKQRSFICVDCGKGFARNDQLSVHLVQVHSGLKPFACSFCDKRFSSSSNKIVHEKIHSTERLKCNQCDYVTNAVANLKRHLVQHQEVYKYACDTCRQQFKSSTALRIHQYTHQAKSFMCHYCEKPFSRPEGLKNHIASVHLLKKHNCPKCDRLFSSKACVRKHMAIKHHGIRFFCQCGKSFDRKERYTAHGDYCELAESNEPEKKSIFPGKVVKKRPGRPAKFDLVPE